MRTTGLFAIIALAIAILLVPAVGAANSWESVGETDGVNVFMQQVPGSSMFAFRGEMVADVHISRIMTVFLDPNERPNWVDRYHSHRTLDRVEKPEENEMWELYAIRFSLPPGISDRDYLLRTDLEVDMSGKKVTTRIRSVVDRRYGEQDCCVRASTQTFYEFTALPNGRTRLIVEVHTDPKGRLPAWLVNRIQRGWPSGTLSGLVNRAKHSSIQPRPEFREW